MEAELVDVIADLLRELAEEREIELPNPLNGETVLLGRGGCLDSLALVNLVVALEEAVEDRSGKMVVLGDEEAFSQKRSPYRTIGSLAAYAALVAAEQG